MNAATPTTRTAREKLLTAIATMLIAIGTGASSGEVYARHCNSMTLDQYQGTLGLLKVSGLVIEASHWLTLTEKGMKLRNDVESITIGKVVAETEYTPVYQCDCSGCDTPLFDTTDRQFYHCCDQCDAKLGQDGIARRVSCDRVEGSLL